MDIQCTELNLGINRQRIMISTRISKLGMPHSNEINRVRSLVAKVTAQPAHGTEQTPGKVLAYYSRQRAARRWTRVVDPDYQQDSFNLRKESDRR